jgi:hypothetical protein
VNQVISEIEIEANSMSEVSKSISRGTIKDSRFVFLGDEILSTMVSVNDIESIDIKEIEEKE